MRGGRWRIWQSRQPGGRMAGYASEGQEADPDGEGRNSLRQAISRAKGQGVGWSFLALICLLLAVASLLRPPMLDLSLSTPITQGGWNYLPPGRYTVAAYYQNSPKGNMLLAATTQATGEDNVAWVEYFRGELPEGTGVWEAEFALEEGVRGLWWHTGAEAHLSMGDAQTILYRVHIRGLEPFATDHWFLFCLWLLAGGICLLQALGLGLKRPLLHLAMVGGAFLLTLPLWNDFLPEGHDLAFHLARLENLYQGMAAGHFPVYIGPVQMQGYGYLTNVFYPYIWLLPGVLFRGLGVSLMLSYKLLIFLYHLAAGYMAYYSLLAMSGKRLTASIGAFLYLFASYRLLNAYSRAALGELCAMVFFPLVIWGAHALMSGRWRRFPILAMGLAGVMLSHILSLEMALLFFALAGLLWFLFVPVEKKWLCAGGFLAAGGLALALGAFFVIPFLRYFDENFFVKSMEVDLDISALYFSQAFALFPPGSGWNQVRNNTFGEMPLSLGFGLLLGLALFLAMLVLEGRPGWRGWKSAMAQFVLALLALLAASWMMPWDKWLELSLVERVFAPFQFPWRLLAPATALCLLPASLGFTWLWEQREAAAKAAAVLGLGLVLASAMYYLDSLAQGMSAYDLLGSQAQIQGLDSGDALYLFAGHEHYAYPRDRAKVYVLGEAKAEFSGYRRWAPDLEVDVEIVEYHPEAFLVFPLYYYPGYEIWLDGEPLEVHSREAEGMPGLLACPLPARGGHIEVRYGIPWYYHAANVLSLAALATLGGLLAWERRGWLWRRRQK